MVRAWMWIEHVFLTIVGLTAGFAVSAGTFAFIIVIGVVPRMVGKSNTAKMVFCYENAIILGGVLGNIVSVFLNLRIPLGSFLLILYGVSAGMFVGCIAVALAEILRVFPIMFHRSGLKEGLSWIMLCMALGKATGAYIYFLRALSS